MTWNPDHDKLYEDALKEFPEEDDNRWEKIASRVPGKSPHDIKAHFEDLFVDSLLLDVPYNEANADPIDDPIDNEISSGKMETSVQSDDSSELSSEEEYRNWSAMSRNYYKRLDITDQPPLTSVPSHGGSNKMASVDGGAMDPLPSDFPRQGGNDPTDTVNGGAMEPPPTNLHSQGGRPKRRRTSDPMKPRPTDSPSQGGQQNF
ncbi:unnamed protein product [Fraxinus pennsylvanica]|uniref:Myb-like domain-containing protein n=1 Tax=Fraxinus pennsylvanica TaxID=56036 RepID=A0AAD2DWM3_9LAMI|nr:unnamed protein product [Fraxinus pennsylvanica]